MRESPQAAPDRPVKNIFATIFLCPPVTARLLPGKAYKTGKSEVFSLDKTGDFVYGNEWVYYKG